MLMPTLAAKRRKSARGAALAEAAVVMPIMCMFLGLFTFAKKSYDKRLETQNASQAAVGFQASHGCTKSTALVTPAKSPGGTPGRCSGAATTAKADVTAANSTAENTVKEAGYSRSVGAGSFRYCDEQPQEGMGAWAKNAGDHFSGYNSVSPWDDSEGCK
jgi:hypothetical protein